MILRHRFHAMHSAQDRESVFFFFIADSSNSMNGLALAVNAVIESSLGVQSRKRSIRYYLLTRMSSHRNLVRLILKVSQEYAVQHRLPSQCKTIGTHLRIPLTLSHNVSLRLIQSRKS